MNKPFRLILRLSAAPLFAAAVAAEPGTVRSVRVWSQPEVTRVVIETTQEASFKHDRLTNPVRVYFDLLDTGMDLVAAPGKKFYAVPVNDRLLTKVRVAESGNGATRLVFDLALPQAQYTQSQLTNPNRLVVEFRERSQPAGSGSPESATNAAGPASVGSQPAPAAPGVAAKAAEPAPRISLDQMRRDAQRASQTGKIPAPPTAEGIAPTVSRATPSPMVASAASLPSAGIPVITPPPAVPARRANRSMTRALGLKLGKIVIDPGHGGHDLGTTSPSGMHEKDLVLDISRRLRQLLEERLAAEVVMTRNDDSFLSLEQRTAFANAERADLFLSIHVNSSPYPRAAGPETYFLNFNPARDAMEVAARENASSGKTIFELQDLVKQIALNEKLTESREFATRVQTALLQQANRTADARSPESRVRDRGVKRAPFVVLIGAAMPSILVELGFVTNPREEAQFKTSDYRQALAESLYRGILQYTNSLSRFQVATRAEGAAQE